MCVCVCVILYVYSRSSHCTDPISVHLSPWSVSATGRSLRLRAAGLHGPHGVAQEAHGSLGVAPWKTWVVADGGLEDWYPNMVPSGYVNIADSLLLKMVMYSEFSHWEWWFSIVMLNYQRVYWTNMNQLMNSIWTIIYEAICWIGWFILVSNIFQPTLLRTASSLTSKLRTVFFQCGILITGLAICPLGEGVRWWLKIHGLRFLKQPFLLAFEEPALCRREAGRVAASTRQKALESLTKMMDTYEQPWARTCPWPPIFSRTVGLSMFKLLKPGGWSGSICSWQNFRDLGTLLLGCVCK